MMVMLGAVAMNNYAYPLGQLGYAESLVDQGPITTVVDMTSLTVTVNVPANRRVRITGHYMPRSTIANDTATLFIMEGATQLQAAYQPLSSTGGIQSELTVMVLLTPAAGSHTYKLRAERSTGTGGIYTGGSAATPNFILVEDIGPVGSSMPGGSGGVGSLLASKVYGLPVDASTSAYTPYTKVDAANLFLTFTAPLSGKVLFRWNCTISSTGGVNMGIGQTAAVETAMVVSTSIAEVARAVSPTMMLESLTPGVSYTYYLWFAVSVSGTAVVQDSGYGPVVLEVWAA